MTDREAQRVHAVAMKRLLQDLNMAQAKLSAHAATEHLRKGAA